MRNAKLNKNVKRSEKKQPSVIIGAVKPPKARSKAVLRSSSFLRFAFCVLINFAFRTFIDFSLKSLRYSHIL